MAEKIALSQPEGAFAGTTEWDLVGVHENIEEMQVTFTLRGQNGMRRTVVYADDAAHQLMRQANRWNCAIRSRRLRFMDRLIADQHIKTEFGPTAVGDPD